MLCLTERSGQKRAVVLSLNPVSPAIGGGVLPVPQLRGPPSPIVGVADSSVTPIRWPFCTTVCIALTLLFMLVIFMLSAWRVE